MDGARFDAWTRRRFGLTAGGMLVSLAGMAANDDDASAKHHHHKKCGQNEKRCGKKCVKGNCCLGKACQGHCECGKTVEGKTFCWETFIKTLCEQCTSSSSCEEPFKCVKLDGCLPDATAVCKPPCGFQV